MNNLLLYLAQASTCLLAFYGFYHLVLRQETCFQYNRAYLLLTPALSFLLPLVPLPDWPFAWPFSEQSQAATVVVEAGYSGEFVYGYQTMPAAEPFDWQPVVWALYGLGFCFFAYRLMRQLLAIRRYIRQHQTGMIRRNGICLVPTQGQSPTFSFLNYLFWDNSQATTDQEWQQILRHESVHIAQKHSWDLLYLELLTLVFWFNPVLYLFKKALASTHEFIADAAVTRTAGHQEYASLLIKQVFRQLDLSLGHYFNRSLTLKRMNMLKRNHLRPNRIKQALALPLVALLFVLVSAKNTSTAEAMEEPAAAIAEQPKNLIQPENRTEPTSASLANPPQDQDNTATFPGGKSALLRHLKKNVKYPAEALKNGITGQAIILVTIDEQGQPGNFKTLQADNPYLEQEAIRVLQDMPAWQPASNKSKAQSQTLAFPFLFGLESNKGLAPLKVPASSSQFALQDAIVVVGYSQVIPGKTVTQSSTRPTTFYPRDSKVFSFVEQQPVFPGGMAEMNNFIRENLKYPEEAKKSGIEGLVVVQFVVDRNGKVLDPAIVKPLGAGTDEEVLRLVKSFPDFEPAKQKGTPVEFRYTLPVRFGLAPKDPANGYIPPSKANPSGSYLTSLNTPPATAPACQVYLSFYQNGQQIDLLKTRPAGNIMVTCGKPEGCPAGEYHIEQVTYFLSRESKRVGETTQESTTVNLTKLLSLAQPGDELVIWARGKVVPGKNGKASSPYITGSHIPLRNWQNN